MLRRKIKYSQGFTLIELLVVIAIIGVLSSVVLASLSSARIKSRTARRLSDFRQIETALQFYYNDNDAFPIASAYDGDDAEWQILEAALTPKYIATLPQDPLHGSGSHAWCSGAGVHSYHYNSTGQSWKLSVCDEVTYPADAPYNFCGSAWSGYYPGPWIILCGK